MGVITQILRHPFDVVPLLKVKKMADNAKKLPKDKNFAFCYDMLNKVSRSFAIVIQQLDEELRDAVCVFYLVLRALDTIEDDMHIDNEKKVPQLIKFHESIYDAEYKHLECGEKHYKQLMVEYPRVTDCFLRLKKPYKDVIADITKRMGRGMADFIESEVNTLEDWDTYCHYVAGLVGIGLSDLWAGSKLEHVKFKTEMEDLSNAMGLFLQKTNIVRDYLEDIQEIPRPRMFWPRVVWQKYTLNLDDFQYERNRTNAVHCLNELITNALTHACDSLEYMSRVKTPSIFRFCAIPQIMAIATLAECYDNGKVFEGVVKIRRGLSARIMLSSNDTYQMGKGFKHFLIILKNKVRVQDPNHAQTKRLCNLAIEKAENMIDRSDRGKLEKLRNSNANEEPLSIAVRIGLLTLFGGYAYYAFNLEDMRESMGLNRHNGARWLDRVQQIFAVLGLIFVCSLLIASNRGTTTKSKSKMH
jgi:farnesyl-diphosphate farnesyltransferase